MALTDIDQEAAKTSIKGGPTDLAQGPGQEVKVASLIVNIWKGMRPFAEELTSGSVKKRVPTPIVESISEEGFSYQKTQEKIAKERLSPEGYEKFKAEGFKAPTDKTLEETLQEKNLREQALKALEARGAKDATLTGVDPRVADEVLSSAERAKISIKAGEGGVDINFNNIRANEDVEALINALSERYKVPITEAKRGKQTNVETLEKAFKLLADEIGYTTSLLKKRPGGAMNAEQLTAARILLVRSMKRLEELSAEVATGQASLQTQLEFQRQITINGAILAQVKSGITEAARSVQAQNIPVGMDLVTTNKIIKEMIEADGGEKSAVKLAKAVQVAMKTGGNKAVHTLSQATKLEKVTGVFGEFFVGGLLSWTTTQLKNIFGTPIWMSYQLGQEFSAGLYGTARRSLTGEVDGVYVGESLARVMGWSRTFGDAMAVAAKARRYELPTSAANKVEQMQYKKTDSAFLNIDAAKRPVFAAAIDFFGKHVVRQSMRWLLYADEFWKTLAQNGELYAQAYNAGAVALREGKTKKDATDAAIKVWLDPRSRAGDLEQVAKIATLTQDAGVIGKAATFLRNKMPQPFTILGTLALPFTRIPTNTVMLVADNSPLQVLNPTAWRDVRGVNGPKARDRRMGNIAMASATAYNVAQWAIEGRLTGAMPSDPEQRAMLPPNWQPYAYVYEREPWPKDEDGDDLPLFNEKTGLYNGPVGYIRFGGIEPVGAFIGLITNTVERLRRRPRSEELKNPDDLLKYISAPIFSTLDYFNELPFLQGMSSFFAAVRYKDPGYLTDSPVSSMIPYTPIPSPVSAATRNISRAGDPTIKRLSIKENLYTAKDLEQITREKNKNLPPDKQIKTNYDLIGMPKDGLFEKLSRDVVAQQRKDGFFKTTGESKAIQYDVLGNEKQVGVSFGVNPVLATYNLISPFRVVLGEAPTPLMKELVRVGQKEGFPLSMERKTLPTAGNRQISLSERQQSDWVNIAKNELKLQVPALGIDGLEPITFRKALEMMIVSPQYVDTDLPDKERRNLLKNIEKRFFDSAIEKLLNLPGNENLKQVHYERKLLEEGGKLK